MRPLIYCIVPRDLADRLHEPLREHFSEDPEVQVVVERRETVERRSGTRRFVTRQVDDDRRRVRHDDGRRVADRRAIAVTADAPPALPRKARRYADQLVFVQWVGPSDRSEEDLDTNRLILRYQSGDQAVLSELYMRYFNRVYSYLRLALRDSHEAEDVAQDVFMRVLGALDRFEVRKDQSFGNWLMRISRNMVLTQLSTRRRVYIEDPARLDERQAHLEQLDERAFDWISDDELMMFVERLPLPQRQVLFLSYMLGLNGEEIATVLGMTSAAVRKARSRATRVLEQRLAAIMQGGSSSRRAREPMRVVLRHAQVLRARRFVLGSGHIRA
jgi:RNA polymerase sigma-70 factor (ECF subfamily)